MRVLVLELRRGVVLMASRTKMFRDPRETAVTARDDSDITKHKEQTTKPNISL